MIKAVVLTRGRTGSSAVIDSLGKSIGFVAAQEVFSTAGSEDNYVTAGTRHYPPFCVYMGMFPRTLRRKLFRMTAEEADIHFVPRYLHRLERLVERNTGRGLIFKVLSHHLCDHPPLLPALHARGYDVVYLRRNPVRQVISGLIAAGRKRYNTRDDLPAFAPVRIDAEDMDFRIRVEMLRVEEDLALLAREGIRFLEVHYEDFVSDRQAFFDKIFDFLGAPGTVPGETEFRVMVKSLEGSVENLAEIREVAARYDCAL